LSSTSRSLHRPCERPAVRFLARGNPDYAFEGATLLRTTLIEFPGAQAAYDAYHSAAYQEALRVLGDAAEREMRVISAME
jgi:uncharacterized protein (DUF1330 family)